MRRATVAALCLGMLSASACSRVPDAEVERALDPVDVIDEANLTGVMMSAADPAEAAAYFEAAVQRDPDRIDYRRSLARSLVRARRPVAAVGAWRQVLDLPAADDADHVALADALIRTGDWAEAERVLDGIPPSHKTYERYRLEAMVADANEEWSKADAFYETAAGLTADPSPVLNNWGFSKLTRGEPGAAERLFAEALTYDPTLFTAKNNLVMARGAQRLYSLPIMEVTQVERAQLLHTLALSAVRQGDVATGEALLREALEVHPRHFDAAARALAALEGGASG